MCEWSWSCVHVCVVVCSCACVCVCSCVGVRVCVLLKCVATVEMYTVYSISRISHLPSSHISHLMRYRRRDGRYRQRDGRYRRRPTALTHILTIFPSLVDVLLTQGGPRRNLVRWRLRQERRVGRNLAIGARAAATCSSVQWMPDGLR
jgi:hypothetical protein